MGEADEHRRPVRRGDARRNRAAAIGAAAALLKRERPLAMQAVADMAGISRSTLYRHFGSPAELQRAVQLETLAQARGAIQRALHGSRPPVGALRAVMSDLIDVGRALPLDSPLGRPPEDALDTTAARLLPLARRLAQAAELSPPPPEPWLRTATVHLLETCLSAGWESPDAGVDDLLRVITEPLDRGLLLMDEQGVVVALNADARAALGEQTALDPGSRAVVRDGGLYEDGSPAPPDAHPLNAGVTGGEPQHAVRGHRSPDGRVRWFSIDVRPLARHQIYGFVAIVTDVSAQTRAGQSHLKPPGELEPTAAPLLDIVRVLDEVPAPMLPEQLVAEATRLAGNPAALYVLDIDGSHLLRLAGRESFPARIPAPLALGPELSEDGVGELEAHLARELPGTVMAPMWLRGRAVGVLLSLRGAEKGLRDVARLGAAALELANGYTDVIDAARRRKDMNPAAEIQQSLIPPRIARLGSGELAGSVLPSYDVGGDWFDYVENRDGAWIAIADAAGKGPQAAGLGGVALAALRAARRNDATLEQAAETMNDTVADVGGPEFFLTAVVARWDSVYSTLSWVNCGHPPPLLLRADDAVEELATEPNLPLGLHEAPMHFRRHQRRLLDGDRLVLYSDGISGRRTRTGTFGTDGIVRAAAGADRRSATATARAIQEAVVRASVDSLQDDAAVVVLAIGAAAPDAAR